MKALFVYSKRAGKNKALRYKNLIVKKLSKKYQVEDICYSSDKELTALIDKSNEYDALVIAVYNRPTLANEGHALDTLLKANNHNKDTWRTTLTNEYKGLANWGIYGNGWTNRINDEIELYFDGDYVRNH